MARWTLYDATVPETYEFPINPSEGGTPGISKRIETQVAAAPDGTTILFEGRDEPGRLNLSGTILDQAHLDALTAWSLKRHQVRITDDLGRQYWVYITRFNPTRNRRAHHPWHHSYQMELVVVDVP